MKISWKKPWTVAFWILKSEKLEVEQEFPATSSSRFGPKGFWGWLAAPESESFKEEPVMQIRSSQYGKGGFWKWLIAREEFREEPEVPVNRPRFGDRTFLGWLVSTEGRPDPDSGSGEQDPSDRSGSCYGS
jgi:hypothetical protein